MKIKRILILNLICNKIIVPVVLNQISAYINKMRRIVKMIVKKTEKVMEEDLIVRIH